MTAAEAKERLVCILNNNQFTKADKKAMYLAINAINRQTPIKPVSQMKFGKYDTVIGLCPTCGCGNNSEYRTAVTVGKRLNGVIPNDTRGIYAQGAIGCRVKHRAAGRNIRHSPNHDKPA